MEYLKPASLIASMVYSLLGIVVFWISFYVLDKMTPYDLWKEIVEKQNRALATIVGAMSIGLCLIIAAAIH
jgi:uncharacterized membrane protein YjfL (UPF0719 family)